MPQLSPLNWMFLFILFWSTFVIFYVIVWWGYRVRFPRMTLVEDEGKKVISKKYKWMWK